MRNDGKKRQADLREEIRADDCNAKRSAVAAHGHRAMSRFQHALCAVFLLVACQVDTPVAAQSVQSSGAASEVPPAALAAGYSLQTFNSAFAPSRFDKAAKYPSKYEWYLNNFFGGKPDRSGLTFNPDGSLTIAGAGGYNGQIATAGVKGTSWVGTAFGGGAYFEAVFKFDPKLVNTSNGWPSFWSMAIEHLAGLPSQQWVGQAAGYSHFIEADFFEYDIAQFTRPNSYGGTLHDWYGIYDKTLHRRHFIFEVTCPGYCDVTSPYVRTGPRNIDWTQYHKFGFLWIPATARTQGSATFYLDERKLGPVQTWTQFTDQDPPPGRGVAWTYGILDNQHIAILLGSGTGQPLTVQSVKVWQSSAAGNLVH
jgi:hypothetical protein